MNDKVKLNIRLGMLLTMLSAGLSLGQSGLSAADMPAPPDVDARRWQRVVEQLKDNGLSTEAARECLAPVQEAARQGLPTDPVLMRVEEGAAKGVEAKALRDAAQQRLANLRSAAEVTSQAGYGSKNSRHDQLIKSVTLALESGLSADTLGGVLARAKGEQSERMRSIVEAGETMRLAGMDETTAGQLMVDYTERNMRRSEVIRATRFAVEQHRANVGGARIRQQLWGGTGTSPGNALAGSGTGRSKPGGVGNSGSGGSGTRGGGSQGRSQGSTPNRGQ